MKRLFIWAAAIAAVLLATKTESPGTDVARLEPIQILRAEMTAGKVILTTDTGQMGAGEDLTAAIRNLKETASGEVFLDTAEYLLTAPSAAWMLPELAEILRPACQVCLDEGITELEAVSEYLSVHKPEVTLRKYRQGPCRLPVLYEMEGRMYLAKP